MRIAGRAKRATADNRFIMATVKNGESVISQPAMRMPSMGASTMDDSQLPATGPTRKPSVVAEEMKANARGRSDGADDSAT